MRKFRNWIFASMLILLFMEVWLGFPIKLETTESEIAPPVSGTTPKEAQHRIKGFHLVESASGNRDWELFAATAEGYGGQGKWHLETVKIRFYSENKLQFTVTGAQAEVDSQTRDMKIEGDVMTTSENGYKFESPVLLYTAKVRVLESPGAVRMTGPKDFKGEFLMVTAGSMRSLIGKSEMDLDGNVVAQKKVKEGKNISIRSDHARFNRLDSQARFEGKVVVNYESMKIESREAKFQYEATKKVLESIVMTGAVRLSDVSKFATSDRLRIEPEANRIVLNGAPRVVQDQDELFGDQIVFLEGGKKVKIEKMRARVEKPAGEQ